jgi:tetratricopeptide (TPR) repeat protein
MQNPAFQRAVILQQQHRYADAAAELRRVLAGDPHDATAHAMLALCLIEQEQLKEATREAEQAAGLAPDMPLAHYALGYALLKRNWLDEAKAAATEAVRLDAYDPDHFGLLAAIEFQRRNWPTALEQAENGLAIDPDHNWCTNLRAMALTKLGRRDEAGRALGDALSRNPESSDSHAAQGWTLLHRGDHKGAMNHFREALRLNPNSEWAKAGMVEALKSSLFLYRWLMMFFLWMGRLSGRAQWGVILGAWVGYQVLRNIARNNPEAGKFLWPILIAYIAFCVMTWMAAPLLNLVLRLHRYGRHILSRDQTVASNWIGGLLAVAGLALAARYLGGVEPFIELAWVAALLVPTLAGVYLCDRGWPRTVMMVVALILASLGLMGVAAAWRHYLEVGAANYALPRSAGGMLVLFTFGTFIAILATNYLARVRPRS